MQPSDAPVVNPLKARIDSKTDMAPEASSNPHRLCRYSFVPALKQLEIKGLSVFVDCAVQVYAFTFGPHICFVHSPESIAEAFLTARMVGDQWCILDDPTIQCRVID